MELPACFFCEIRCEFPIAFKAPFAKLEGQWNQEMQEELRDMVRTYEESCVKDPNYKKSHNRPTKIEMGQAFDSARMLRLCNDLRFFATIADQTPTWTNQEADQELYELARPLSCTTFCVVQVTPNTALECPITRDQNT